MMPSPYSLKFRAPRAIQNRSELATEYGERPKGCQSTLRLRDVWAAQDWDYGLNVSVKRPRQA